MHSVLAGVLLVVLGIAVTGCATATEPQVVDELSVQDAALAGGWDALSWTGDGRFAVLQTFDAAGTPVVMAWDAETGEVSEQSGYRVLAIEPASSVLWLEPMSAEDVGTDMMENEYAFFDLGPFDGPAASLEAW